MTNEELQKEAARILPFVQAMAEGKAVEYQTPHGNWVLKENFTFYGNKHRVAFETVDDKFTNVFANGAVGAAHDSRAEADAYALHASIKRAAILIGTRINPAGDRTFRLEQLGESHVG